MLIFELSEPDADLPSSLESDRSYGVDKPDRLLCDRLEIPIVGLVGLSVSYPFSTLLVSLLSIVKDTSGFIA